MRTRSKYAATAPCGLAIDMPLSLSTRRNWRCSVPALFRPSIATPFTMLASPMITATRRPSVVSGLQPSPPRVSPRAMPTAVEMPVPAWPTEKRS